MLFNLIKVRKLMCVQVEVVSEHFRRQEVVEIDTIILFSHMIKKNKEKNNM